MYYPVAVPGGFFSVGHPHAAQATATGRYRDRKHRWTGDFEFILHNNHDLGGTVLEGLTHPMLETDQQWSMYGFTFTILPRRLGANAPIDVANHSSLDKAMRDAFRKLRRFLMTVHHMSED